MQIKGIRERVAPQLVAGGYAGTLTIGTKDGKVAAISANHVVPYSSKAKVIFKGVDSGNTYLESPVELTAHNKKEDVVGVKLPGYVKEAIDPSSLSTFDTNQPIEKAYASRKTNSNTPPDETIGEQRRRVFQNLGQSTKNALAWRNGIQAMNKARLGASFPDGAISNGADLQVSNKQPVNDSNLLAFNVTSGRSRKGVSGGPIEQNGEIQGIALEGTPDTTLIMRSTRSAGVRNAIDAVA